MANVAAIKFAPDQPSRFFRFEDESLTIKDFCLVPDGSDGELRVGFISGFEGRCPRQAERLPAVVRRAQDDEIGDWHRELDRMRETLRIAREKAFEHDLPIKILSVRIQESAGQMTFFFTAERRVDFRELVRDLAGTFKMRIELWQIGSRQGTAELGGFGQCGREICCAAWMDEFPTVTVRQARDQDIHQPPPKLAGQCGRLLCCLRYEHEAYCELRKGAPDPGDLVRDSEGREGVVADRNLIRQQAWVRFEQGSTQEWLPFDQVTVLKKRGRGPRRERQPKPEGVANGKDATPKGDQ